MDLYCQKCGEPENFMSTRMDFTFTERKKFDAGVGCPACKWGKDAPKKRPFRSELASMLTDILGDDIDGIASEMDDAEWMFGEKFWEE